MNVGICSWCWHEVDSADAIGFREHFRLPPAKDPKNDRTMHRSRKLRCDGGAVVLWGAHTVVRTRRRRGR